MFCLDVEALGATGTDILNVRQGCATVALEKRENYEMIKVIINTI